MSTTLLALALSGRRVVLVGGGAVSARRAADLVADGAVVTVVAPQLDHALARLVADGRAGWVARGYAGPADLEGAWLVHTATGDPQVDEAVASDAESARIFCVRAGAASEGTAQVPARGEIPTPDGPVRVAVHAGGDPRRAVAVRNAVVEHLGAGVVDLRVHRPRARGGWVALVGAGPGDDGLLTRRAATLLASADVVVADRLVPQGVLAALPESVEVIDVGKVSGHHPVPQEQINRIIVEQARAGRGVVRLKGGDPYVLGRGGEERLACEAAGVRVEVVPGITSAVSVPAAAGIPVTHRGVARGFTVVTGHEEVPALPGGTDHTLVLLMGVAGLRETAALLVRHGRPAHCPVGIVERGWTPDQRVTLGTLGDIADRAEAVGVASPAVVVVGDVVRLAHAWRAADGLAAQLAMSGGAVA
ncbi:uroporphyrinogen-III C-methyltransferase [Ornithinimicrobium tianjinense]|uniref:uroporphyrinogen-III C-methyltransferase n=1 Tax=Ornithinimicrobium tianjinense TaxID=1195761 RepID=A0A917BD66_9MICO|nr:uroporphyrinogen-III C-methyltransferase [Ornithinimicrobium tianjinense]GGF37789.1 uroporphyrinogen-III C-methyltransferase [Ornithinimicrobium tianjinense]